MIKSIFNTVVLTSCLALAGGAIAATPTANTSVSSEQQGMHQWQVLGGKLILITGTYQDILAYKRSLTFYFESKPGEEWMHAPVLDGDNRNALTWFSISQGEQTVAKAVNPGVTQLHQPCRVLVSGVTDEGGECAPGQIG